MCWPFHRKDTSEPDPVTPDPVVPVIPPEPEHGKLVINPSPIPLPVESMTPMPNFDLVVLHSEQGFGNFEQTNEYATGERGFSHFPYHFFVDLDGTIFAGVPVNRCGIHARNYNRHSVGIALRGNCQTPQQAGPGVKTQPPTIEQLYAVCLLVPNVLLLAQPGAQVAFHRDLPLCSTDCPGNLWTWPELRDLLPSNVPLMSQK